MTPHDDLLRWCERGYWSCCGIFAIEALFIFVHNPFIAIVCIVACAYSINEALDIRKLRGEK